MRGLGVTSCNFRKSFLSDRLLEHWDRLPREWPQHQCDRAQEVFGQHSQGCTGWDCWDVCAGPGAGFNDPSGFLPTQDFLCFYSSMILSFCSSLPETEPGGFLVAVCSFASWDCWFWVFIYVFTQNKGHCSCHSPGFIWSRMYLHTSCREPTCPGSAPTWHKGRTFNLGCCFTHKLLHWQEFSC